MHLSYEVIANNPGGGDSVLLRECLEATTDCAIACDACAAACLREHHVRELLACIRACLDCADVCHTAARILARVPDLDSRLATEQMELCRLACALCAEECEKHASRHPHCRICAEACRKCDVACSCLIGEAC